MAEDLTSLLLRMQFSSLACVLFSYSYGWCTSWVTDGYFWLGYVLCPLFNDVHTSLLRLFKIALARRDNIYIETITNNSIACWLCSRISLIPFMPFLKFRITPVQLPFLAICIPHGLATIFPSPANRFWHCPSFVYTLCLCTIGTQNFNQTRFSFGVTYHTRSICVQTFAPLLGLHNCGQVGFWPTWVSWASHEIISRPIFGRLIARHRVNWSIIFALRGLASDAWHSIKLIKLLRLDSYFLVVVAPKQKIDFIFDLAQLERPSITSTPVITL